MVMTLRHSEPAAQFGILAPDLLSAGFPPLPVIPGEKRPAIRQWTQAPLEDPGAVAQLGQRYPEHSVGVRVGQTSRAHLLALDLDIGIPQLCDQVVEWIRAALHVEGLPLRAGKPPRRMVLVQADTALNTGLWRSEPFCDMSGTKHRIEVLGEGRQFVAYGAHPEGGQFSWLEGDLLQWTAEHLPTIDAGTLEELFQQWPEMARSAGLQSEQPTATPLKPIGGTTDDGGFAYREPVGADPEELRRDLALIPADGYHDWVDVGQALYHEFDGGETGFELWDEWSRGAPEKYPSREAAWAKWRSFRGIGVQRTITVRAIQRRAEEARTAQQHHREAQGLKATQVPSFRFEDIPPRRWVLGRRLMAQYLTATFAPGGVAKSVLSLCTAVSIATGRDLTGEKIHETGPAWIINNEDDLTEILRRLAAISTLFGIPWQEIQESVWITSGYGRPVMLATEERGAIKAHPNVDQVVSEIQQHGIRYVAIDPLVSIHSSDENSNVALNKVVDILKDIASRSGAAVELIHHTRKGHAGGTHAGDAEAGRGGSALKDAARIVATLARVTPDKASELGITSAERPRVLRLDLGKSNFALPDDEALWFRLESVQLPQGDSVGVPATLDISRLRERREEEQQHQEQEQQKEALIHICEAIPATEQEIRRSELDLQLEAVWGVGQRQVQRRVQDLLGIGRENAAQITTLDGNTWRLFMERGGRHATAPMMVKKEALPA